MADLTVRRGQGGGAMTQADPFGNVRDQVRRMQNLLRDPYSFFQDPFGELEPFMEAGRMQQFIPDFEVRESQGNLVICADLPGVKQDDVEVTVVGNRLRINGKREFQQENRGDTWYAAERAYGNFSRTFILPEGVNTDDVNANLENGVLNITIPKRAEAQPRKIALGGQQRTIEGQYSQGPFQQSQQGQPGQPAQPGQSMYGQQQQGQQYSQFGQQGQQQGYAQAGQQPGEPYKAGYGAAAGGTDVGSEGEKGAETGGKKVPEKV